MKIIYKVSDNKQTTTDEHAPSFEVLCTMDKAHGQVSNVFAPRFQQDYSRTSMLLNGAQLESLCSPQAQMMKHARSGE